MIKTVKYILGLAILFFLIAYLYHNWRDMRYLLNINRWDLLSIYVISLLAQLNTAYNVRYLLFAFQIKTGFGDMFVLQNAVNLLNYVPMKFGTLFRANYLKRHYGLTYARFGAFFVYLNLLMFFTASVASLCILISVYDLASYASKVIFAAFALILVLSFCVAFVPLPAISSTHKLGKILNNFLDARHQMGKNKKTLIFCTLLLLFNFIITSIRLGIIYHSIGQELHPAGYLILGALGYTTLFLSLTPGSLGIRELVLSSGGVALGIPLKIGILAALIDRAVALSWVFVIGSACTTWLWRKYPADFTTPQFSSKPGEKENSGSTDLLQN